ncbi:HAMP domain-containing sensor histidine kinase [Bdellovibrionota bacterium FG-1]
MAAQVAHDIRSPLAAMAVIEKDLSPLPENTRLIVRNAIGRIRDIATNLTEQYLPHKAPVQEPGQVLQLLSSLIESLVTEKRTQYRDRMGIEISFSIEKAGYGLFAYIQPREFKRVLSNLINNAVEAIEGNGRVGVTLSTQGTTIAIGVSDTGKGIPFDLISKLDSRGETHGKTGGTGLGLYHAKSTMETWGGSLSIESAVAKGTQIKLTLPAASAPNWFVETLLVPAQSSIVVVDDDASIHSVWNGRFDSLRLSEQGVTVFHFSAPKEFQNWMKTSPEAVHALFLMDYELLGHTETGLDLIESFALGAQAVLVTSRYEERSILERCSRLNV